MKELACFASGIFTYSANLAFRIFAILFDFALMVTFACIADPQWSVCSIVQRKVLDFYEEMSVNGAPHRLQCFRASVFITIVKLSKSVFYGISVCIGIFICTRYSKIKKDQQSTTQLPVVQNASNTPVVQAAVEAATKSFVAGEKDLPPAYEVESKNRMGK